MCQYKNSDLLQYSFTNWYIKTMEQIIAAIFPLSVAVALSPMPIAALMLMLLSKKAKVNSVSFAIGWIVGLAVLVWAVSFLVAGQSNTVAKSGVSLRSVIDGLLGMLLIIFAIKQWRNRPKKGQVVKVPGWMNTIEKFSPVKSFSIGFLLATLNFKNTPVGIAVGSTISKIANSPQQSVEALIIYLLLASCTITIPVIGFLLLGRSLNGVLSSIKSWLINNNATIMFVLFLIIGAMLLSKAFGG